MKINVTQEHIDTAHCHSCYCPIALAVKEVFGIRLNDERFVDVFHGGIIYISGNEILLPQEAELFIQQYDDWSNCHGRWEQDPADDLPRGGRGAVCPKPIEFELEYEDDN